MKIHFLQKKISKITEAQLIFVRTIKSASLKKELCKFEFIPTPWEMLAGDIHFDNYDKIKIDKDSNS